MTYRAGILQHCVSEAVVPLCFQLQVIGALEDGCFLQVTIFLVLVGHRVLAVVSDGLRGLFGQQSDEGHLHCDRVYRLILVAISELKTQI